MGPDVAVVVGHSRRDKGAVSATGVQEWDWNQPLAARIVAGLAAMGRTARIVLRDDSADGYRKLPAQINAIGARCAVELHLNAAAPGATGTETLYWAGSRRGHELALQVQTAMVRVLGLADRGAKGLGPSDRGGFLLQRANMPAVITEPAFLSNPNDLDRATAQRDALGEAIAGALHTWLA